MPVDIRKPLKMPVNSKNRENRKKNCVGVHGSDSTDRMISKQKDWRGDSSAPYRESSAKDEQKNSAI